jgi:hypothetical protein
MQFVEDTGWTLTCPLRDHEATTPNLFPDLDVWIWLGGR